PASATTEIYPLSLHDALPIFPRRRLNFQIAVNILGSFVHIKKSTTGVDVDVTGFHDFLVKSTAFVGYGNDQVIFVLLQQHVDFGDRKSTRLNSSHVKISYAVF